MLSRRPRPHLVQGSVIRISKPSEICREWVVTHIPDGRYLTGSDSKGPKKPKAEEQKRVKVETPRMLKRAGPPTPLSPLMLEPAVSLGTPSTPMPTITTTPRPPSDNNSNTPRELGKKRGRPKVHMNGQPRFQQPSYPHHQQQQQHHYTPQEHTSSSSSSSALSSSSSSAPSAKAFESVTDVEIELDYLEAYRYYVYRPQLDTISQEFVDSDATASDSEGCKKRKAEQSALNCESDEDEERETERKEMERKETIAKITIAPTPATPTTTPVMKQEPFSQQRHEFLAQPYESVQQQQQQQQHFMSSEHMFQTNGATSDHYDEDEGEEEEELYVQQQQQQQQVQQLQQQQQQQMQRRQQHRQQQQQHQQQQGDEENSFQTAQQSINHNYPSRYPLSPASSSSSPYLSASSDMSNENEDVKRQMQDQGGYVPPLSSQEEEEEDEGGGERGYNAILQAQQEYVHATSQQEQRGEGEYVSPQQQLDYASYAQYPSYSGYPPEFAQDYNFDPSRFNPNQAAYASNFMSYPFVQNAMGQ